MKCPKCNSENEPNALYCSLCYEPLRKEGPSPQRSVSSQMHYHKPVKTQNSFPFMLVVLLCIIAGAIYMLYPLINGPSTNNLVKLNSDNFESNVLKSDIPVLVYFYGKGLNSTIRNMLSIIDEFASLHSDKMKFCEYKISDDDEFWRKWSKHPRSGLVVIKEGVKEKESYNLIETNTGNKGMLFLFLKDYIFPYREYKSSNYAGIKYLTEKNFQQVLSKAEKPLVVNFSRDTCPACSTLKPHYMAIADKYSGVADFSIVDTINGANTALKKQYKVKGVPTLIYFYKGKEQARKSGCYNELWANESEIIGSLMHYCGVQ